MPSCCPDLMSCFISSSYSYAAICQQLYTSIHIKNYKNTLKSFCLLNLIRQPCFDILYSWILSDLFHATHSFRVSSHNIVNALSHDHIITLSQQLLNLTSLFTHSCNAVGVCEIHFVPWVSAGNLYVVPRQWSLPLCCLWSFVPLSFWPLNETQVSKSSITWDTHTQKTEPQQIRNNISWLSSRNGHSYKALLLLHPGRWRSQVSRLHCSPVIPLDAFIYNYADSRLLSRLTVHFLIPFSLHF